MKTGKSIIITKVVTRNFIVDFIAKIQNALGMNLTGYEKMMDKGVKQCQDELADRGVKLKWYHYQITQLNNDAVIVMLYGDAA